MLKQWDRKGRQASAKLLLLQGNTTEKNQERKDQNITAITATAAKTQTLLLLHCYLVPFLSACR
jgi:hypothetical protein